MIATIILRCPKDSSQLTDSSPKLCKPYLQVHDFATPYVQPYYQAHVEPHLQKVQPYIDQAQSNFIQPASTFAQANYVKYGAPRVASAQRFGQKQWDDNVLPQLSVARHQALKQYDATLGPYVQKAEKAVRPYYTSVTTSASDLWELEIQPAYKFASPYIQSGYREGEKFFLNVALPYSQWANGVVWTALNRHVFPTFKVLYGENVEPQIMRIKQRLGRYRDERKVEAVISSAASSASESSSSSSKSIKSSSSAASTTAVSSSSVAPSSTPSASPETEKNAGEQFAADLDLWEEQVSRAVSEGAEHLKDRVADITKERDHAQVKNVGESLVIQLEEVQASGAKSVERAIKSAVAGLPEDYSEEDVQLASKDVESYIRSSGKQVREKAQQIREWRKKFDAETTNLVEAAANSTLETIDNIRELRLQEIGRRWASHSAITHRDWARYNQLKRTSGKWRDSIADIVTKHDGLSNTRAAAADIEERAMAVAEDAAKELGRLKSVALWKLRAKDESDDFTSKVVPPVVAKVKEQVVDAANSASEAVLGTSQGTVQSVTSAAASKASSAIDVASEAVIGSSNSVIASASSISKSMMDSSIRSAASSASSLSEQYFDGRSSGAEGLAPEASKSVVSASSKVLSGDASVIKDTASSLSAAASDMLARASQELNEMPSEASKTAKSQASAASEAIVSAAGGSTSESPLSKASKSASSLSSSVANASPLSAMSEAASDLSSSASSVASGVSSAIGDSAPEADDIKSTASKATSRVFAGAMAQAVPSQQPIFDTPLDDDESTLDTMYDKLDSASEQANRITKAASEAIYGKTESNIAGTATSVASELWDSAYKAASSALYGPAPTDGGIGEYLSAKYDDAVKAASRVAASFTPTPTPTGFELAAKVQSQIDAFTDSAYDKWQENIAQVQAVSAAAASRISEQISGTPKPIHEQMLQSVHDSYWDALHGARSKYDALISQTKKFQQSTQAPYESISSVASENLAKALKQVSAKYSEATSAAGYQPTPGYQSAVNEAQRQYYEGLGFAHDQYSSYLRYATRALQSAGLPFVTPAPTPYYEQFLSTAKFKYDEASSSAASVLSNALASASSVAGATSTSPAQSVLDAASSQYDSALSAASKLLYTRQTPVYINYMQKAQSRHSDIQASASEMFQSAYSSALSAAGYTTTSNPAFASATDAAWASYDAVIQGADDAVQRISNYARTAIYGTQTGEMASASSRFSEMIYGTEKGWSDSVQTQAVESWEAIVSKASEQVYGKPSPVYASVTAQITSAAAQATSAVADQYSAVSALFASLVSGQEPDYTDKIFAQLSSAYYTGAANVASSVSSLADQATSAVASVFTAPPAVEEYLSDVQRSIDAAVSAASVSLYGTPTGTVESATSAASSAVSSAAAQVSETVSDAFVVGLDAAKLAQVSFIAYAEEANNKIYTALFGEPTPVPLTDSVASQASNAASQVSSAAAQASEALFGKEKEDVRTSAAKRLDAMIETARKQVEEYAEQASKTAAQGTEAVKETVQSVVDRVKDEL
ncbi:hypothetical protein KVT40_007115 [Elsinoe batatas]|uniref:Uncharacterized protein n=1 Tax=Elsinoe batatas TaxID=2601811 RepID=A0A8K0PH96_9PEZI|nr:hypothetical protein KVT40_007115 [Elsinoe batatas]